MVKPSLVRGSECIPAVRSHDGREDDGCVRYLTGGEGQKAVAGQRFLHVDVVRPLLNDDARSAGDI